MRRIFTQVATPLALGVALLFAAGCRHRPATPRLVLLYATCTLNQSYLWPYNDTVVFTPELRRFAQGARVFRRHQTESGQSGTAFASLFSGTQADHHGVFRHPTRLEDRVELIGESFRRAGWEVSAWLEHGMASQELGYAQGVEAVHDTLLTADDADFIQLLDGLARDPERRALVYTSFSVTHGPYRPGPVDGFCRRYPQECTVFSDRPAFDFYAEFYRRAHAFLSYDYAATAERASMNDEARERLALVVDLLYRANVGRLDTLFGEVMEALRHRGLEADSIVVFTADHGETLFRPGTYFKWTHGHQLAPEVLSVPLLIRAPGVAAGDWPGVTRSIDVFPTLAGLARVPLKALPGRGVDLSAALQGQAPPPTLSAYSHTSLIAEPVLEASKRWGLFRRLHPRIDPGAMWVQVRQGDRVVQLRRDSAGAMEPTVFDLAADPHQLNNLYRSGDGEERPALRDLARYLERLKEAYNSTRAGGELDRQRQEELLRGLGYID